jgi:dihydropteroate synthase
MDATPSVDLPTDAPDGRPADPPHPLTIRGRNFAWGSRTFVMGIVNVTPDSFSGDGLLTGAADPVAAAVEQARRMVADGADLLDVGGQSTRPGHAPVEEDEERRRVVPVVAALREALPDVPISIDTLKPRVAEAALDAGADLVNDVGAVYGGDPDMVGVVAERGVPYLAMHHRAEARYRSVLAEVMADLQAVLDRAVTAGVAWTDVLLDPGIGFGKTPEQNLYLLARLGALRELGRPVVLGVSRKSTIGKVLDLPAPERLEGTVATTTLAAAARVDIVRVHDVRPNVRAARMADAIHRRGRLGSSGWEPV